MSQIKITNLCFTHENSYTPIFEHVTLQLDTNWKLGLIGRNGRGKTTFLKLLMGTYSYSGSITASTAFDYFPFSITEPDLPVLDLLETLAPQAERWQLRRELSLLALSEDCYDQPFATLSNGEQTKVQLAALFLRENHFLLIDEPTNHLDLAGRQVISRYLNRKEGFILVSHDRHFLDGCIDHVLSINRSDIELQEGNFTSWYCNRQRQDQYEQTKNQRLQKEIGQLKQAAQRTANWSDAVESTKYGTRNSGLRPDRGYIGHKAAKMMKRSKTLEQRLQHSIEQKSTLLQNIERADPLKLSPLPAPTGRLVSLQQAVVCYDDRPICQPVTFNLMAGDRIALAGSNGSGKSSLIKLILGQALAHNGNIECNRRLKISYVSQSTDHLHGNIQTYAHTQQIDLSLLLAILNKLGLPQAHWELPLEQYSLGQRKKVLLAASLCQSAHLYIWDEPLNYLDITARLQLEDLLLTAQPTLLFVEHDQYFIDRIATDVIQLHKPDR